MVVTDEPRLVEFSSHADTSIRARTTYSMARRGDRWAGSEQEWVVAVRVMACSDVNKELLPRRNRLATEEGIELAG